ncbi:ferredoxin--NADP reductase [Acanthopleuribacter pedis]|uniref:Ferredoxin--NADP reductase n=1 Tax=Acanthopleuribacter pedis TaxID=442870 RepID=A0A8J7QJU9_9BACT|nr:ferredoxin--NADP reductase [Acanthopleuribacter pedis]MBO1322226.1 ferredoxin--NADP reductase [Acanthopleuribacter pedis]
MPQPPRGPFPLKVTEVHAVAERAKTLVFAVPAELQPQFTWRAGQFITVHPIIDGKQVQRAYSLCTGPVAGGSPSITVQRVENGLVSNYLHDHIGVGDSLLVSPPRGNFCADIQAKNHRTYYAFAAGSGITPIFAQVQQILATESTSHIFLLYGCRDEDNIIFAKALEDLAAKHHGRLQVDITLSRPRSHQWRAMFSTRPRWTGATGRIDGARVKEWAIANPPPNQTVRYLVCGPGDMIDTVINALGEIDVAKSDILSERFGAAAKKGGSTGSAATLSVTLAGKTTQIPVAAGQTLLQAMTAAGVEAPFSCQAGVCGSCRAKCTKGRVEQPGAAALSEKERADGYVLTCRAQPTEAQVAVRF